MYIYFFLCVAHNQPSILLCTARECSPFITNCIISLNPNCTGGGGALTNWLRFQRTASLPFFSLKSCRYFDTKFAKIGPPEAPVTESDDLLQPKVNSKSEIFFFILCTKQIMAK